MQGGDSSSVKAAGLPNITSGSNWVLAIGGDRSKPTKQQTVADGCLTETVSSTVSGHESNNYPMSYSRVDASLNSSIYGASTTVQPPSIVLIPQIRY